MKKNAKNLAMCLGGLLAYACTPDLEEKMVQSIIAACPLADPADSSARETCANALAGNELLRQMSHDPLSWGAQKEGSAITSALSESSVIDFNPLVWRKMYLSTFMFEDHPLAVQEDSGQKIIRARVLFRYSLDAGEFPYPFWHSATKWTSYQLSRELIFYFRDGIFLGALRSNEHDLFRPRKDRFFDGRWRWEEDGEQPHVSLYRYLFSASNPHVPQLESAYRELEESMRTEICFQCHMPDNPQRMQHLELLSYPNQALSGRHDIVRMLEQNSMPPITGIINDRKLEGILSRARTFAVIGDAALEYEQEPLTSSAD